MNISGISLILILLFSALVTQGGILSASATGIVSLPPRNLIASPVSDTQSFLIWSAPINATGVLGYKIEFKTGLNPYSVLNSTGNLTSYLHNGLITNTTYTYRISAINSAGTSNPTNETSITTLSIPSTPRNLTAVSNSSSQINLSWIAPNNNGGTAITGYQILRENSCTGNFIIISNTTNSSSSYSDSGLAANTCYRYNVKAINVIGIGIGSITSVTSQSLPIQNHVPNSPRGLSVTTISGTSLRLTWLSPSDNGGVPITGYLIQRNGTTIIIDTSSNKTSYIDANLLPVHQQSYRIAAWNNIGLGSFSNPVSGITNSTIILPSGNGTNQSSTNLGKLISDLEHKRNLLLKQQRQEILAIIHDCRDQIKNASSNNITQVIQSCKVKTKESRAKYSDLRHQLNAELANLKTQFKLQKHDEKNEEHSEKENNHSENMTRNIEINSEKQANKDEHKHNQKPKNHDNHENED